LRAIPPEESLRERFVRWRNRRISDPAFQRWAASFPLTRGIAAKKAASLFDVTAGFVYSQALAAAAQLDLFSLLKDGAMDLARIAQETKLPEASALTLLRAGAALDLFEEVSLKRFALGEGGAALVGNPGVLAMIAHHGALYRDLADPVGLLRERPKDTALSRYWRYPVADDRDGLTGEDVAAYSALMAASQSFIAADLLDAYPFYHHRTLLDIGAGAGAFLTAALERHDGLQGILFDLPAVAEIAREAVEKAGLGARIRITSGDFCQDSLPEGADVATLVRVLHDHDDDKALAILKVAYAALRPSGTLVIAEPMAGAPGARAMGDAYFGLYLLAMGSGRPRTAREIADLARMAGFRTAKLRRTRRPLLVSVLVAR
jgi:demethylspheroidene O-methyltransferase